MYALNASPCVHLWILDKTLCLVADIKELAKGLFLEAWNHRPQSYCLFHIGEQNPVAPNAPENRFNRQTIDASLSRVHTSTHTQARTHKHAHTHHTRFLDASSHLYKRVCPSVRPCLYVRPYVTRYFWFLKKRVKGYSRGACMHVCACACLCVRACVYARRGRIYCLSIKLIGFSYPGGIGLSIFLWGNCETHPNEWPPAWYSYLKYIWYFSSR